MNEEEKIQTEEIPEVDGKPFDFDPSAEEDEGLYGWKFHRGPLLAAVVLTVLFYVFVFLWVD